MSHRGNWIDASIAAVGNTSVALLPFRGSRTALQIHNGAASGGNNIAVNLTGGTAVINGAGCITLAPGGTLTYTEFCPVNAITVIASGSSTPVTCVYCTGGTGA